MDTSEKIKVFGSFEELTQEIIADKDANDMLAQRYAIRFIMLNNFNEFKKLAMFMVSIGVKTLDLETLIPEGEDDTWITTDMLRNAITSCKDRYTFVTPFSEIVRFYDEDSFRGFFNQVLTSEDTRNPKKRIYIPLIGLQNRFVDFLNHYGRIEESAPIWRYDAEAQSVEVFFSNYKDFTLPNDSLQCQLDSFREWLMFWKKQAPQERIVCTSKPIAAKYKYSKPDNIFNFTKIANAYEFMTQFLELRFPFNYADDDKKYWEELLKRLDKNKLDSFSFESFVRTSFNKVKFDATDIIGEWLNISSTPYERWLLKKYVQHTGFTELYPYFVLCIDSTTDLSDEFQLTDMIATRILYSDIPDNKREVYAPERRQIIVENHYLFEKKVNKEIQAWLFNIIRETYQQQNNLASVIDLCTGVFDFEKKLLMGWSVFNPNNKKLNEAIDMLYPEYAAYLSTKKPTCFNPENQWVIEYIKAYKKAKMEDKYGEEIPVFIKSKNLSSETFYKWYFEFDNSHDVLAKMYNNVVYRPDKVFWVDGLGIEFLSYVIFLIEKEHTNMKVVHSQITRSYLPSSTHHNRFEGENVKKFGALDELGHDSHGYKYLDTLKDELDVIKNIVHDIVAACKNERCTVAIVSDHGLSCLSRKAPSKKYEGKFEHEGRYIKTTEGALSDSDYIVHVNEEDGQKYKVALTHSSLSKSPTHQVHGGCTPEEVLVPFILISNKELASNVKYQVVVSDEDIMLSNPVVNITVIPQPQSVALTYDGETYNMERIGTQWKTILKNVTEGEHVIDIKPFGAESKEVRIKIIGVGVNSDINDMFDI
jgi:hypothetical protein